MRKNFGAKAMLYPMPVLIIGSYDENGTPDAMNAAWGGISEETQISICVSEDHKTTKNILARGAFTVSVADAETNKFKEKLQSIYEIFKNFKTIAMSPTGKNCFVIKSIYLY